MASQTIIKEDFISLVPLDVIKLIISFSCPYNLQLSLVCKKFKTAMDSYAKLFKRSVNEMVVEGINLTFTYNDAWFMFIRDIMFIKNGETLMFGKMTVNRSGIVVASSGEWILQLQHLIKLAQPHLKIFKGNGDDFNISSHVLPTISLGKTRSIISYISDNSSVESSNLILGNFVDGLSPYFIYGDIYFINNSGQPAGRYRIIRTNCPVLAKFMSINNPKSEQIIEGDKPWPQELYVRL